MRELKFRSWDTSNKIMLYSDHSRNLGSFFDGYCSNGNNEILLQYTGINDVNGQDIYEGDILSVNNNDIGFLVKFGEYDFSDIYYESKSNGWYLSNIHDSSIEYPLLKENVSIINYNVVGNMYEHPHLLNTQK